MAKRNIRLHRSHKTIVVLCMIATAQIMLAIHNPVLAMAMAFVGLFVVLFG